MKKNSTVKKNGQPARELTKPKLLGIMEAYGKGEPITAKLTIGLDVGDRASCYCVLDEEGEVIGRSRVATARQPLQLLFGKFPASVVALEVGTHSPWVSRLSAVRVILVLLCYKY